MTLMIRQRGQAEIVDNENFFILSHIRIFLNI
jgi:hypothetical protein